MVIDIILNNGKRLLLDKDAQIEWVQENMFFEDDIKLRGKYSYPFSVNRAANSDALGFVDVVPVSTKITKVACQVYVNNVEFYKGQINILDWTDDNINIAVTRNTDEIDTSMYIDEMDLPVYSGIAGHTARNNDKDKFYPDIDYAWPQFYNKSELSYEKYGADSRGNVNMIVNWRNGSAQNADGSEVIVPMFYWLSVINNIFLNLGLSLKTDLFSDLFFNKLLIYNPITAVENETNCLHIEAFTYNGGFGVIRMADKLSCFSVPAGTNVSMIVWEYDSFGINQTTTVTYTLNSTDVLNITNLMTSIRVAFISAVTNATLISENYSADKPAFVVQLTTGDEMQINSVGSSAPDPTQRIDRGVFKLGVVFNANRVYVSDVLMKMHLPHITVSSLLNAAKQNFNLAIFLDEVNEVVKIYKRNDIIRQSEKRDLTQFLLNIIEGAPFTAPNYKFEFDHDKDNDLETADLQNVAGNIESTYSPVEEWNIECGTLTTRLLQNSNSGSITTPVVNQELGDYTDKPDFGYRLLFLNGYIPDTNGKYLVNAVNDGLLPDQIFHDHFKDWYALLKKINKSHTLYMDFGIDILKTMSPFIWKIGFNDYLWKRITTVIHNTNGIQPSKVEGYKL